MLALFVALLAAALSVRPGDRLRRSAGRTSVGAPGVGGRRVGARRARRARCARLTADPACSVRRTLSIEAADALCLSSF